MPQIVLGFVIALGIAGLAYRLGSLSLSGAAAALGLGTLVFGLGGWEWAVLLVAFFASSSGLTRFAAARKQDLNAAFAKGGRRDAGQVLANGGLAGLFVLAHVVWPDWGWTWLAYAGALAAVNADTWATELGVLSHAQPRLISTLRPVERGTSGGVTVTGTLAAAGGGLWIGLLAALCWPGRSLVSAWLSTALAAPASLPSAAGLALGVAMAGLAGSLLDSLLGATLQAIYYCPACGRATERHPRHTCGTPTRALRGLAWLGNDGVNLACAATGALVAAAVFFFI